MRPKRREAGATTQITRNQIKKAQSLEGNRYFSCGLATVVFVTVVRRHRPLLSSTIVVRRRRPPSLLLQPLCSFLPSSPSLYTVLYCRLQLIKSVCNIRSDEIVRESVESPEVMSKISPFSFKIGSIDLGRFPYLKGKEWEAGRLESSFEGEGCLGAH